MSWGGFLVLVLFVAGVVVVWHAEPLHGAIHDEGEVTEGDDWFEVTGGDGGDGNEGNGGNGGGGD